MARINTKGQIKGSVGPIAYHNYNGTTYIQSKPGRGNVKQTQATLQSASDFGRASSLAKAIRQALFPILQNHSDTNFYRRFTAAVNNATQDGNPNPKGSRSLLDGNLELLMNVDCNISSPFGEYCGLTPTLTLSDSRQLTIALPTFAVADQIAPKPEASHAALVFLVTTLNPETNTTTHAELFRLDLTLDNSSQPAHEWTTTILPDGQLIVVASALFYYRNNNLAGMIGLNSKEFHPCEVCGVLKS